MRHIWVVGALAGLVLAGSVSPIVAEEPPRNPLLALLHEGLWDDQRLAARTRSSELRTRAWIPTGRAASARDRAESKVINAALGAAVKALVAPKHNDQIRRSKFRRGRVSSDFGAEFTGLGTDDAIAAANKKGVRVTIRDLLENDLGYSCDYPCNFENTRKLELTKLTGVDNVDLLKKRGRFVFVRAEVPNERATFNYHVFDHTTGHEAEVQVNVWFGNRQPKARRDRLRATANQITSYDVSDLLGNDRDRDGDPLDLVRVWCPKGGRVFTEEVNGETRIFFQPEKDFVGVTYFKYTIADLNVPRGPLVAGLENGGDEPPLERKTYAEGVVRVRVRASPS